MAGDFPQALVILSESTPIWDQVFTVAPLILVGTREPDGANDFAPKHMATPVGWGRHFGFVCTPSHATHANVNRTGEFTVSYPRPSQILETSLAAAPRTHEQCKPSLQALKTFRAQKLDAELVADAYIYFECKLQNIMEFDDCSLIVGEIVLAYAHNSCLRSPDRDDQDIILKNPMLAYLSPGRLAIVNETQAFPFHKGMRK